ncbi:hypothetical protein [Streptomyces sp. IBSBF 2507]|uniref:hypothetical protein n=1 Tax=Streptomyces sp. IBSBF 2507 TaxID=2903530 RepID=UPI00351F0384
MADDVTITVHVRDLSGPGFNSVNRNIRDLQRQADAVGGTLRIVGGQLDDVAGSASTAGQALGKSGGGLGGVVTGLGAAVGTSLLPTLGALAPMLAGVGVVGGGVALAMDDLKKKAKELKPAFEDWKKATERAVAPHTERAVKSLKSAMKDLQPSLVLGAETFGTIAERASKFAASDAFQSAFQRNAQMGVVFVEQLAESVGKFTQSFLEFGTKSKPALDAWEGLLGGLFDTGLPGMFDGLEQGIGGASEMLTGFADFLNNGLLPALGKIAGSFAEAFGPLLGALFSATGDALMGFAEVFEGAMTGLEPFARVAADALTAVNDVMMIGAEVAGTFAESLGGALLGSLLSVMGIDTSKLGDMTGGFTKLSDWVNANEGRIRGAFYGVADGITTMVTVGISMLPELYAAFRMVTEGILTGLDGMVSTLAATFGDVPIIGDKFKQMNADFDTFAEGVRSGLDKAGGGINSFVDEAIPRLNRSKLTMNVSEAEQNLASLKEQLEDPALTKERRAELKAEKRQAEQAVREAKAALKSFDGQSATGTFKANSMPFFGVLGTVKAARVPTKTGTIKANRGPFDAAIGGIAGRVVGTAYINVYSRQVDSGAAKPFRSAGGPVQRRADGGPLQHFPSGGLVEGPGGPRSDSILATFGSGATAMVSDTEYVVQSSAVKKYGLPLLDALNRGTLKLAGGGVTKAEAAARKEARSDLTLSRFGWMAGWRTSEFGNALGNPGSVSALVSALNQWRSTVMKATHGRTEKDLLNILDQSGKLLLGWQKQLTKTSASLEKARDKLDSLKQAASQLAESVKSGVLNSSAITRGRQDGPVTLQSIMSGLIGSRDKSTAFTSALKQLKDKKVSSDLIQQIAEAGIEGGGLETASALLKASPKDIAMMNLLQKQITIQAGLAGSITSDAVYGAEIKGQEQYVKALQSSVTSLGAKMDKLAAAMEKYIEMGLGMKATGGIIGAASGGARGSWTMVGEHEPELVRLPFGSRVYSGPDTRRMRQQAWASMLNTPQRAGGQAAGGGAAVQPVVVHQTITLDGRVVAQQIFDPLRKEIANRGGSVQRTLGQGAG